MENLGFIFDLILFGAAIYLYLFSIGYIKTNQLSAEKQEQANEFRSKNKSWLKILSLLLAAIMLVNIILRLKGF